MRTLVVALISVLLILGLPLSFLAEARDTRAELNKISNYIIVLDQKIEAARTAGQMGKVAELKVLKRSELERAKKLKAELAKEEQKGGLTGKRGFGAEIGYAAGAGLIQIDYIIPFRDWTLIIDGGAAVGNAYSVILADLCIVKPLGVNYAGLELTGASYSNVVTNIPGLSGNISKGGIVGVGLFGGRKLGRYDVQIGYNSALGVTLGGIYKF